MANCAAVPRNVAALDACLQGISDSVLPFAPLQVISWQ